MIQADHIAVLVRDLDASLEAVPSSCTIHPAEEHASEGTRERYVAFEDETQPSLLLMQAIAPGPYQRALEKRGPGLHHVGCVCASIEDEIHAGALGPLLLHPLSLQTVKHYNTAWLCRPGTPFLLELLENPQMAGQTYRDATIEMPGAGEAPPEVRAVVKNLKLLEGVGLKVSGIEITP